MMTELAQIQSELENSVERLTELAPIFDLVLDQLPEQADEVWQQRVRWLLAEMRDSADCERDLLYGLARGLYRFQVALVSEVSQ